MGSVRKVTAPPGLHLGRWAPSHGSHGFTAGSGCRVAGDGGVKGRSRGPGRDSHSHLWEAGWNAVATWEAVMNPNK